MRKVIFEDQSGRSIVTEKEAVVLQRRSCVEARGRDLYKSDEDALEDFLTVHWAWIEE